MLKKQYVKSRRVSKVTFELPRAQWPEGVTVESAHLVGDFNGWDSVATPMKRGKGATFRVTLELEPGREYQFRYLVNGEHWCNDRQADGYVANEWGSDNSIVVTPDRPD